MAVDTKELIAEAVKRLLMQKKVKKLTVKDIVDECSITRQTFYYHFEDIPDLLKWVLERGTDKMVEETLTQGNAEKGLRCLFRLRWGFGLCKVRVPYPLADTFLFPGGGVYLDSPLAGHFLRDFFTRLILFYVSVPPIRALARAQYSAFISMPI